MTAHTPSGTHEEEIWRFIKSRQVFTHGDVEAFCSAGEWKRTNYLRNLTRLNLVTLYQRKGNIRYYTAQDPATLSGDAAQIDSSALDAQWRSDTLGSRISAAQGITQPVQPWTPETPEDQKLWDLVRGQIRFTRDHVLAQKMAPDNKVTLFLRSLENAGLLRSAGYDNGKPYYTAFSPSEIMHRAKDKRLTKEGRIWTAMRAARKFTIEDLLMTFAGLEDEFSEKNIRSYCSTLQKAGYLKDTRRGRVTAQSLRYHLVRDTGPLPPTVKRVPVVTDANEGRVVYVQGEETTWATT
ncbi:hypothetical protein [Parasedimentitalea psychrophila]|uniref:Uncharacterized protein n=1 Tax=Parasedimentitalea psychrophila TaxID=2997337 RepID=A0A9Y2P6T0_9RHOB|nr:hypothetical protein [Parasedimentitalea psychrophila]WIY25035.1 hypothetical protein QPJ95_21520 [Parasedimentitalea psychrophila]